MITRIEAEIAQLRLVFDMFRVFMLYGPKGGLYAKPVLDTILSGYGSYPNWHNLNNKLPEIASTLLEVTMGISQCVDIAKELYDFQMRYLFVRPNEALDLNKLPTKREIRGFYLNVKDKIDEIEKRGY